MFLFGFLAFLAIVAVLALTNFRSMQSETGKKAAAADVTNKRQRSVVDLWRVGNRAGPSSDSDPEAAAGSGSGSDGSSSSDEDESNPKKGKTAPNRHWQSAWDAAFGYWLRPGPEEEGKKTAICLCCNAPNSTAPKYCVKTLKGLEL